MVTSSVIVSYVAAINGNELLFFYAVLECFRLGGSEAWLESVFVMVSTCF